MASLNTQGFVYEINDELFPGAIPQTLQEFKLFIKTEESRLAHVPPNKRTPLRIGAICLQSMIKTKIAALPSTPALANRLNYFNSKDFLDNFCEKIDFLTKYGKKSNLDGSYSNFFNVLFNTKFKGDYRASSFSLDKNPKQCQAVLGNRRPIRIGLQHDDPCYICGRDITRGSGVETMQCEHILPITTALTNWWLVRKGNKRDNEEALYHEYKWSHQCCNQKKGNYDFVMYTPTNRNDYGVNDTLVRKLLKDIKSAKNYDCEAITGPPLDVEGQVRSINALLQPIVEELNSIHAEFDNRDEYLLLTKFKLVSALTDPTLDALIKGSGTGVLSEPQKKKKKRLAKKAKEAEEEAEEKRKNLVDKENRINARAEAAARRAAERERSGGAATEYYDDKSISRSRSRNRSPSRDRSQSRSRKRDSDEDAVANVILFDDDDRYDPSIEDLRTEYMKIFGTKHTYYNDDGTTTAHWRQASTPGNISVRQPRVDMTRLTDQERLQRQTGNKSMYSGRTPFGRGANKKKRRRSNNATRKMSMKGKKAVKKPTRKKRNSKKYKK